MWEKQFKDRKCQLKQACAFSKGQTMRMSFGNSSNSQWTCPNGHVPMKGQIEYLSPHSNQLMTLLTCMNVEEKVLR
jgi:hypothetical protein